MISLAPIITVGGIALGGMVVGTVLEMMGAGHLKPWVDVATYLIVGMYAGSMVMDFLRVGIDTLIRF